MQKYTVKVTSLTGDGAGIGRAAELAVFTDGALPGDLCEVKIIKFNKNYAYGKLLKIIEPSLDRVKPVCCVSDICGGCALQSLNYGAQLKLKHRIVADCLERIGGIKSAQVHETIGMDGPPYNYRNKSQFPVKKNKRNPAKADIGFYSRRTHDIININACAISCSSSAQVIKVFRHYLQGSGIAYDEITHTGIIRHIFVRSGFNSGEIMVCIVAASDDADFAPLVGQLKQIPGVVSVMLNINPERTNAILGKSSKILHGRGHIFDYIAGKKFKISLGSFYQVNPAQTERLYAKAIEFAQVDKNYTCIDAYCGIGTIALMFAPLVKKIYGVEISGQAVTDARENALMNNISNAEFIEGKAEQLIPELAGRERIDLLIVDPPRKGCNIKLLEAAIAARVKAIIYISCDPATLARDIKILCAGGYSLNAVQPVDMFPHTMHVECVAALCRSD